MRISDWSSDVCSSDLGAIASKQAAARLQSVSSDSNSWSMAPLSPGLTIPGVSPDSFRDQLEGAQARGVLVDVGDHHQLVGAGFLHEGLDARSEEPTSELQSLMRNSYAVFDLK